MSSNTHSPISHLAERLEEILAAYYAFEPVAKAGAFLIDDQTLAALAEEKQAAKEYMNADRGSVVFFKEGDDDFFIGIHVADHLSALLQRKDPITQLDRANLDALCLVIEEVSHFHLILNRMANNATVTRIELEWQAEVDKLLVASTILHNQYGKGHDFQLAQIILEDATIASQDVALYQSATRYAAKLWHGLISKHGWQSQKVRGFLQENYRRTWGEKHSQLSLLKSA